MTALDGGCVETSLNTWICSPRGISYRGISYCPTCKQRRRTTYRWAMWYGTEVECCGCGDRWQDGVMAPRPFERGWRGKATAVSRAEWPTLPNRQVADTAIQEYLRGYFAEVGL